jgi:hypothetical protein
LFALGATLSPALAWAQAAPVTPPPATSAASSGSGALMMVAVIVGLLVIVGVGVKLYDLKRKREAESVHLQAQISDALLRDQGLFGMPVTPTVGIPLWSGTPAIIELVGEVDAPGAHEAALRIVREEASRVRSDFRIEDRIRVRESARSIERAA